MALVGYSPWTDASRMGSALADTLGQILLGVPQIRAQQAERQAMMPLQMRLLQARAQSEEAYPQMQREQMQYREDMLGERERNDTLMNQYRMSMSDIADWRAQFAQRIADMKGQGAQRLTPSETGRLDATVNQSLPPPPVPGIPFQISPDIRSKLFGAASQAELGGQSPSAAVQGQLGNYQWQPNLITNIISHFLRSPTQQVSTNRFDLQPRRVKVRGPNGESGTVDATEQLPQGWQIIQ